MASNSFFLANARFTKARPGVLQAVIEELGRAGVWADSEPG